MRVAHAFAVVALCASCGGNVDDATRSRDASSDVACGPACAPPEGGAAGSAGAAASAGASGGDAGPSDVGAGGSAEAGAAGAGGADAGTVDADAAGPTCHDLAFVASGVPCNGDCDLTCPCQPVARTWNLYLGADGCMIGANCDLMCQYPHAWFDCWYADYAIADAGTDTGACTAFDAGATSDAGADADAGANTDAGADADAGANTDAGAASDAATADSP